MRAYLIRRDDGVFWTPSDLWSDEAAEAARFAVREAAAEAAEALARASWRPCRLSIIEVEE